MAVKIYACCKGKNIGIEEVSDPVFSNKILGEGTAIIPEDSYVCAPIDGVVESIFPTKHAFVVANDDVKVMVHIGLETVKLKGLPFKQLAKEGQSVQHGQPIIKSNFKLIRKLKCDDTVMCVVLESEIAQKNRDNENVTVNDIVCLV